MTKLAKAACAPSFCEVAQPVIKPGLGSASAIAQLKSLLAGWPLYIPGDPAMISANTVGAPVQTIFDFSQDVQRGPELIDVSPFNTGWVLDAGVTLPGGNTIAINSAGYATCAKTVLTIGRTYEVTFTVTRTGGQVRFRTTGTQLIATIAASGTYTYIIQPKATTIQFQANGDVGGFVGSVSNIRVKEILGNHAVQETAASQGIYGRVPKSGRRNLFTFSEQFDNAAWAKSNGTITANATTAPDGQTTADRFTHSSGTVIHFLSQNLVTITGQPYTLSFFVKLSALRNFAFVEERHSTPGSPTRTWFNLSTGLVGAKAAAHTAQMTSVGDGWFRCSITFTSGGTSNSITIGAASADNSIFCTADGGSIFVWGGQFENSASPTIYQCVVSQFDVTESGQPHCYYIQPDGVDDNYLTLNNVSYTGTSNVTLFSSARRLGGADTGTLLQFDPSGVGSFGLQVPVSAGTNTAGAYSRGDGTSRAVSGAVPAVPFTSVITGICSISQPVVSVRSNGVQIGSVGTSQGAGNYGNYPIVLFTRPGTPRLFNGQCFFLAAPGKSFALAEIQQIESLISQFTPGVSLPG